MDVIVFGRIIVCKEEQFVNAPFANETIVKFGKAVAKSNDVIEVSRHLKPYTY